MGNDGKRIIFAALFALGFSILALLIMGCQNNGVPPPVTFSQNQHPKP